MSNPPLENVPNDSRIANERAKLDAIVAHALTLSSDDGIAFLREQCAGNDLLLAQAVERVRSTAPNWWELSIESRAQDRDGALHERTGDLIGCYRIVRSLGSGGMGEVLLAERDDGQFRQKAALKLVRRGALSPTVQARLKAERQILAALEHPNIARLLDGGTTADGTPYIVMEYIEGEPIDVYCDRRKLALAERIRLFRSVCAAVHCAHQNLVVHRDLKPSNILVAADGTPKLLDFGIAKILDDRPFLHTMAVTEVDMRVMTPEHASPEQVRGDVITTSSDVYCLGVLLYQLLSGARPYAIASYRLSEVERAICDDEPRPLHLAPAHAKSDSEGKSLSLDEVCARRGTTPTKLRRALTGDLANIVMTALRKEPERRYASAERFSDDLERYLSGRPVHATKDDWTYRAHKFVLRHRFGVAIGAAAVVGVIAFSVVTLLQSRAIAREQARAEYVSSFLIDMFEHADPSHSRGRDITVRELLDIGARNIDSRADDQGETRARVQATLGKVYADLGLFDRADRLLKESLAERLRAFGPDHVETADAKLRLGEALLSRNDYDRATPLLRDALAVYRRHGKDDDQSAIRLAASQRSLGIALQNQQQIETAEKLLRASRNILEPRAAANSPLRASLISELSETLNHLAQLLEIEGKRDESTTLYQRALDLTRPTLGEDHPVTANNLHNLGMALERQGRFNEARPILQASLETYRKVFGPEHFETLTALANYGMFLHRIGDFDAAERTDREVLTLDRKVRGENHSFVGYDRVNLGLLLHDEGRYREAEAEFRQALAIYDRALPSNHAYIGSARRSLGITLLALGQNAEAERELRMAIEVFQASLGADNPQLFYSRAALGAALTQEHRYEEAETLLRDSYKPLLIAYGADHPNVVRARGWIEKLYAAWDRPERARALFATARDDAQR